MAASQIQPDMAGSLLRRMSAPTIAKNAERIGKGWYSSVTTLMGIELHLSRVVRVSHCSDRIDDSADEIENDVKAHERFLW